MGRPDLQLKEVCVPLLYTGFGVRSFCLSAILPRIVLLLFGFGGFAFAPSTLPTCGAGGWGRPDREWVERVEIWRL